MHQTEQDMASKEEKVWEGVLNSRRRHTVGNRMASDSLIYLYHIVKNTCEKKTNSQTDFKRATKKVHADWVVVVGKMSPNGSTNKQ